MSVERSEARHGSAPANDRASLLNRLCDAAVDLEPDALAILVHIAERARQGAKVYSPLVIARDKRDFAVEALWEHVDALFYMGASIIRWTRLARSGS